MRAILGRRISDRHGSGAYGASRGDRVHRGVDLAVMPGSIILASHPGRVTKLGYPYNPTDPKKGHFRYVEVTTLSNHRMRYFYVKPLVEIGDFVTLDSEIGVVQSLEQVYRGITNHVHFEVIEGDVHIDPEEWI